MRIIIISNRLPVKVSDINGKIKLTKSEGGLVTGLQSLQTNTNTIWIGWPDVCPKTEKEKTAIDKKLQKIDFHPVFLSQEQITGFYEGYSNSVIWPLCHYFYYFIQYNQHFWNTYKEVNRLFCEKAEKIIKKGDIVWVQDYHLMLLPGMLREKFPNLSIGYFHHIPFPSYELFRVLPERAQILKGLLGADLIGFHTHDYMRHFISTVYRVLGMDCQLDQIHFQNRKVYIDAFPMGINYDLFNNTSKSQTIEKKVTKLIKQFGSHKLALSIDRLDYSKGILHRLQGFEEFLDRYPDFRAKLSLVMVVVPSRDKVEKYADLKTKIDETIGRINGKYSTPEWRPVYYFYRSFQFEDLVAFYKIADIALVTPLRDGMNLVAKEYIASKAEKPGVLILSEMAGAATELKDAIIINPNDINEISEALKQGMEMADEEKAVKLKKMQAATSMQNVNKWASNFVRDLVKSKEKRMVSLAKHLDKPLIDTIKESYRNARRRLIVLDYDGTLVPLVKDPQLSVPGTKLLNILSKLTNNPKNKVLINSGRDPETLDNWLGQLSIDMAAEHGAFYKTDNRWYENAIKKPNFNQELFDTLEIITEKTPGSHIERKKTSIVWHYRNCDAWLADLREKQLTDALIPVCTRAGLQIMKGNKIVEIKDPLINKGNEIIRVMEQNTYDFFLAMGDDVTDEDMFRALPEDAITIKVGSVSDTARFSLKSPAESLNFLEKLSILN
jgi:trehalose 6-phosphate synthase/phosphatase